MKRVTQLCCLAVVMAALGSFSMSQAQVTTATVYGIVQDQSGAVIPGANVTLTNQGTGAVRTTTSSQTGEFAFSVLPVGAYSLKIEAAGFKVYVRSGFELAASQVVRQPYTLELGAVTETVEVAGSAPLIETASTEQRESLNRIQVAELPLSRRNVTGLLKLSTGVDNSASGLRINGLGINAGGVTVDGTDAGATPSEGRDLKQYNDRNYIDVMSIDAVQEVQVIRGIMPAEYGGVVSGQVNIISKSGTNEYHGSLFHLYRSHLFNARNPFQVSIDSSGNKIPRNREVYNQFGGTFGGPIIKNRVFMFGSYEGYRESRFQRVNGTVPTDSMRQQILEALPFPETKMLMDALPRPTIPLDASRGRFEGAGDNSSRDNNVTMRGDVRVTDYGNLALTYNRSRPFNRQPSYFLNHANDRDYIYNNDRFTAQYTTGSSNWVSESRVGYNYGDINRLDNYFKNIDPNGTEGIEWQRRVPRISLRGVGGWGSAEVWLMEGTVWTFDQKISRHSGDHSFKFGARVMYYTGQRTNPENPSYSFNNLDDMRANIPSGVTISYGSHGPHKSRMYEISGFIQDDWRVSHRLTLNVGTRYDFFSNNVVTPTGNVDVRIKNLEPPRPEEWPLFKFGEVRPFDKPINNDGWVNLSPRFGFAYKVDRDGKTIVRGGFGVLFAAHPGSVLRESVSNPIVPFRLTWSKEEAQDLGIRYPMYNEQTLPIAEDDVKTKGKELVFSLFDPGFQNAYTMNYQLNIQRELASNLMWEVGFVGLRGVKFIMHRFFNLPDRETGLRPNPLLIPGGYYVDNSDNTTYSSLQTSVRKRFSRNLSFDVHYTWGKVLAYAGADVGTYYHSDTEEDVQDFFNLAIERGHPRHDVRHRMVADWIYEIPVPRGWSAPLRGIAGGWQVSGFFTAEAGRRETITQGCSQGWTCRADYVGGDIVFDNWQNNEVTAGCPVGVHCDVQYLNRAAFATVPEYPSTGIAMRPGNIGTSLVRGPGFWQVDFAAAKNFSVRENMRLQVRLDMFNALNKVNLSGVSSNLESGDFGRISSARGMRVMQIGARLTF